MRRTTILALITCLAGLTAPDPGAAQEAAPPAASEEPEQGGEKAPGLPYEVSFEGIDGLPELAGLLAKSSLLVSQQERGVETRGALRRRAEGDMQRLKKTLNSEGYYGGEISYRLEESEPPLVRVTVTTGPLYRLAEYKVVNESGEGDSEILTPDLEALGLELGMPARGPVVAAAQGKLIQQFLEGGFPKAEVVDRKAFVNHEKAELYINLRIASGEPVTLGEPRFEGVETIDETYLRKLITWETGELYDVRKLDETERELIDTNLFTRANLAIEDPPAPGEPAPVVITVQERPPRSIGFSLRYDSIDSIGGTARWQHRNFFGAGERFVTELDLSTIRQSLDAQLRVPYFADLEKDLIAEGVLSHEDTDAYEQYLAQSFLGLEEELWEDWTFTYGGVVEFEQSSDQRNVEERQFLLFGTPLELVYDGTDDLLDPKSGQRLQVFTTPYVATGDDFLPFIVGDISASTYHSLDEAGRFVAALRGRIGSVVGASADDIPTSKRFYAGGGGSVRGYEYQSLGPLDASGDPLGGLSVAEINAELRIRVTEDIGIVPFLDAGIVSEDAIPGIDSQVQWAAGLGLRYYTAFGPIRLDVAVPLNRRTRDDAFAFYISIGQAF
jgi:translocation and assembly module TamA